MSSSSPARGPLAAVSDNKKRSADKKEDVKQSSTDADVSPYDQRIKLLQACRQSAAGNKILMFLSEDILECIPGKLEELGVDEVEGLDEEQRKAAYSALTQQEVDKYLQAMVVDRELAELQGKYYNEIMFADSRNNEEGIIMLNTYSSWCMYPVIYKLLTSATKKLNQAKKAVENANGRDTKNMAAGAFNNAFATILACDAMDHWRMDTESPEDCEKVAKRISKLASDLLWFDDAELGLVDDYTRKTLLLKLASLSNEWNDIGGIKYKNTKNGQGLGRSHAPPPPAKKPKTVTPTSTASANPASSSGTNTLVTFLSAISDKKKRREKTCVQLQIASVDKPEKSDTVVVSGAIDMKKVNQVCAYVSGQSQGFEYHSQRGTCIKGSRIEVVLEESTLWLAAKSLAKEAAKEGVSHVEDKTVKIIQVFQGLVISPTSGMVYDSNEARNVKAFWVSPNNERYEITVQAIIPNKCIGSKLGPMPRLVKQDMDGYSPHVRTGFGKGLYAANRHMQGDRHGPQYILFSGSDVNQVHAACQAKPIANADGTVPVADAFVTRIYWTPANIATAGPP